jgi:asparagine synthase (glutamine-hydrolysing)
MPGINILIGNPAGGESLGSILLDTQKQLISLPDYRSETLFCSERFCAGCTRYPDYPITVIEAGEMIILIEGRVYNKTAVQLEKELVELAGELKTGGDAFQDGLRDWLSSADGDFLVFVWNRKSEELCIFNDALGRLPIYYAQIDGQVAISRRVKFCTSILGAPAGDRMGVAMTLLFGFSLGKRTLIEGVSRLLPGTLLSVSASSPRIQLSPIYTFNFDCKTNAGKSYNCLAREIEELFLAACRNRAGSGGSPPIVALSGGLDSKAVAAGLQKAGVAFEAASFLDFAREREPDTSLAGRVAEVLGIQWRLFDLKKPDMNDYRRMVALKDGLCGTGMSFILDFFEQIKEAYGPSLIHFTGDEGNILVPDMRPPQRLKTIDDLVDCIISNNLWFPMNEVHSLTGVSPEEIRARVRQRVESYPEQNLYQKYLHFIIFEHCFKLQFEGEEKSRSFFWTVAPFYSLSVFTYLMNIPDDRKRYYRLYDHFFQRLSPATAAIDNVGSLAVPLNSPRRYLYLKARELFSLLPASLKIKIRSKVRKPYTVNKIDDTIRRHTIEMISGSLPAIKCLDPVQARGLLSGKMDKAQFEILTTVILYLGSLSVTS